MVSYFLGYGTYVGAWMFYAVRFFLTIRNRSPITVTCHLIPISVAGIIAICVVARTPHFVPGHYILMTNMLSFGIRPVLFLPPMPITIYWALSFPGIKLYSNLSSATFTAVGDTIGGNVTRESGYSLDLDEGCDAGGGYLCFVCEDFEQ
ncbi:hypothetical protein BDV12DRAFT_204435 [Aspergillus spectabilis]